MEVDGIGLWKIILLYQQVVPSTSILIIDTYRLGEELLAVLTCQGHLPCHESACRSHAHLLTQQQALVSIRCPPDNDCLFVVLFLNGFVTRLMKVRSISCLGMQAAAFHSKTLLVRQSRQSEYPS